MILKKERYAFDRKFKQGSKKNQTEEQRPPFKTSFQDDNWKETMATHRTNVLLSCLNSLNFRSICHSRIARKHLLCLIFILFLKIQSECESEALCAIFKRDRDKEKMVLLFPTLLYLKVTQLCPTLCNPMDYRIHGILQARILEWVAFPFSRASSQPRDRTRSTALQVDSLPVEPQGKPTCCTLYLRIQISCWCVCVCVLSRSVLSSSMTYLCNSKNKQHMQKG